MKKHINLIFIFLNSIVTLAFKLNLFFSCFISNIFLCVQNIFLKIIIITEEINKEYIILGIAYLKL